MSTRSKCRPPVEKSQKKNVFYLSNTITLIIFIFIVMLASLNMLSLVTRVNCQSVYKTVSNLKLFSFSALRMQNGEPVNKKVAQFLYNYENIHLENRTFSNSHV